MCTLYFTNITSQDKSFYIFPISLTCLPYKSNINNPPASDAESQRGRSLRTCPECYAMSDTCNLKMNCKKRWPPPLNTARYSTLKRTASFNVLNNWVNGQCWNRMENIWRTVTHHFTVQYTASFFFIIQIKHAHSTFINETYSFNLSRRADTLKFEIKDIGLNK